MFSWLRDCHVHVLGLGLMGASLGMALRDKVAHLSGSDINAEVERRALGDCVIDEVGGLDRADLVILAIPAHYIPDILLSLPDQMKKDAIIMDLGSTKAQVCSLMGGLPETVQAVGGHPMCGLAENGYQNAIPTLYTGARFILCETARTTQEARSLAEQLVATVGALPLWMDALHHDRTAGAISHLPHLMSFALMRLAMQLSQDDSFVYELAAGGFDGATRLARTDEAMITGMFRTNADQLRQLTALLQSHLDQLTALLDDPEALRQELSQIVNARRDYTLHYGERLIT